MRWTIRIIAVLAILWLGYAAWPFFGLYRLVNAVEAGDVAGISKQVNFAALRQSLTEQIFRAYLRLTGREVRLGHFRELAVAATTSIADPIVARLISAEAVAELLRKGWPTAIVPARAGAGGIDRRALGTVWQLYANSEHGVRDFKVSFPADAPLNERFKLRFRLTAWKWKLAGIELPEELQARLAQELIKVVDKK